MKQAGYLKVVSVLFLLIALLHLLRLVYGWEVVMNDWQVPMGLSWVALVVTGYLGWKGWKMSK